MRKIEDAVSYLNRLGIEIEESGITGFKWVIENPESVSGTYLKSDEELIHFASNILKTNN